MAFAIVGYFDEEADKRVKGLWEAMAKIGVDDYLIKSENSPHIKFAMYEDLKLESVEVILEQLARRIKTIPVQFKSYSFYPNERPFIVIDIAVSLKVLELQKQIRLNCDEYAKTYDMNYFDEGIWKPDCQLTIELEKEKLIGALSYLSNTTLPFWGEINRVGILEFPPAKQLASYNLMGSEN